MPESAPTALAVPAIDLRTDLLHLGLRADGSLDVPPIDPGAPAAWYVHSPTPGERGPAVLLGHVSSAGGSDGVFARLAELGPGDTVEVSREDGLTAIFEVTRAESFDKERFPTAEVYGNTDGAELRLITCDGYNRWARVFEENHVVFARLVGSR